ncbi:S-type pyocin domain-containing protein, partial [Rahnella bruchi]|uniref:S-type pyocin domain-containing protein n=1 Tax=Rahnella bruchi TaxID=1510573 RepID=UPI001ABFA162
MALDADKMTAAGYYHHPDGNGVDWQRDLDMSGSVEDTLGVEGYVSGDFSRKLNALNGGLGMSLVFRPGSVSQTVDALAMARSVAQIHQQELSIAVDDAHKKQVALDEQLTHAQNQRLNAEISLRGKNNAPAGERAQATLDLQQALARELQARMAAEENAVLYIEADIMLNNGRVWWPRSAADVNQARQYIAKRQGDKAATEQLIAGDKKDLAALLAAAERTKQDIDRIRSGLVPEKYRPDSEKAAARQQQLTGAAARRQLEQQQEAAVQRQIDEYQYQINIAVQQKASADGRASAHDGAANNVQNEQNVLRQRQQQLFDGYQRFVNQGVMNDGFHPLFRVGSTMLQQSNAVKAQADAKQNDINRERNAAAQARHEAAQLQQRAEQYQRDKAGAENRLNALRQEHQARAQADAAAASQASSEAAARQAADAKAKAEADARARAAARLRKATAELMARASVHPAPVYTAQMVSAAETALRAPGAMVLGGHPGTAQFAAAGSGAMELADDILYVLSKGWAELKRAATVNALGPRLGVVVAGFWPMEAGKGSDKVPGRDVPALFSYPLSAVQGSGVSLTPGASTANLPVRGALVLENDRLTLRLLKTGEGSLPGTVPVLKAVRDEATGLDRITVPAVGGLPPRTVLINPVPVPVAPADTGNRSPVPVTPWHTGTAAKPVE